MSETTKEKELPRDRVANALAAISKRVREELKAAGQDVPANGSQTAAQEEARRAFVSRTRSAKRAVEQPKDS